jgi:acyl-CoA hydrolase
MSKYVTAEEAVKVVKSADRVYLQAAAAAPTLLANALTERASELRNVEICHLHMFRLVPTFNILLPNTELPIYMEKRYGNELLK